MASSFYSKFISIKDEQRRARRNQSTISTLAQNKFLPVRYSLNGEKPWKEIIQKINFYIITMTTLTSKYLTIYKTFFIDIVSSQSFPLFIIYLIFATNCFRWKKIAGPIHFQKVSSSLSWVPSLFLTISRLIDSLIKIIAMIDILNIKEHIICA